MENHWGTQAHGEESPHAGVICRKPNAESEKDKKVRGESPGKWESWSSVGERFIIAALRVLGWMRRSGSRVHQGGAVQDRALLRIHLPRARGTLQRKPTENRSVRPVRKVRSSADATGESEKNMKRG